MSIRIRLVVLCVVVSVLPALPLSFLVRSLLEKSFNIGLSGTVEQALESGLAVSRSHFAGLHAAFEEEVGAVAARFSRMAVDSFVIDRALRDSDWALRDSDRAKRGVEGFFVVRTQDLDLRALASGELTTLEEVPALKRTTLGKGLSERSEHVERGAPPSTERHGEDLRFFETEDRALQLALWVPGSEAFESDEAIVFYKHTDPGFLAQAGEILEGNQIFAQLLLSQPTLSRSFFYPFVIIYGAILLLSLSIAILVAERMSDPIRRLAHGADAVAEGDWSQRIAVGSGGEIGRLVRAFNNMVSRLDAQSRRIVDMEKMASWREVARHLAHEIKNPLLPIRLTVQELRDQYRGDDARYRELVDESARIVGDELDHLQDLVKEFSSFARMPDLIRRAGSLESLVRDVSKLYPQIRTTIESDPRLPDFAFDSDQMRRVLVNLMDNALSVSRDDTPVEVSIRLSLNERTAVVSVSDNGPGIAKEIRHKIFEPYFTTRKEGSGLGLAMVKNIVLLHGGSIEVGSREGQGAEFTITLPLEGPHSKDAPGRDAPTES